MTAEQRAILDATAKVAEWVGFSKSSIRYGRGWDDQAERLHAEARAALAVLSSCQA